MDEAKDSLELIDTPKDIELVPTWQVEAWWFFVAAGLIVLVVAFILFLKRKRPTHDPLREKREAYSEAEAALSVAGERGSRETAIEVSLILRRYLARSLNEPALFETHEEFIARHDGLASLPEDVRNATGEFFERLAALKYAPEEASAEASSALVTDGKVLLERIYQA